MTSCISPRFDSNGLNIVDPHDKLGDKTEYLSQVHRDAFLLYAPRSTSGVAVDVGCGFGRLTPVISSLGYPEVIGIDPDEDLLTFAKHHHPGPDYRLGKLPELPLAKSCADLIVLQNVFRPLKLLNQLEVLKGIKSYLAPSGKLLVVDNVWPGNSNYCEWEEITDFFKQDDYHLNQWIQIRRGRWWPLFFIQYGFIPRRFFPAIARRELRLLKKIRSFSRWQYTNTLFLFEQQKRPISQAQP